MKKVISCVNAYCLCVYESEISMPEDNVDTTEETQLENLDLDSDQAPELNDEYSEMKAMLDGTTSEEVKKTPPDKIKSILSMRVPLIVKVAQKKMTMENVLRLSLGSIIQFDKDVYENIELMVSNQTIGLGQPVKIGENFGLRLLQVGDLEHTIKSLGGK